MQEREDLLLVNIPTDLLNLLETQARFVLTSVNLFDQALTLLHQTPTRFSSILLTPQSDHMPCNDFIHTIHSHSQLKNIPIILISPKETEQEASFIDDQKIFYSLTPPIEATILMGIILMAIQFHKEKNIVMETVE